MEEIWKDIKGYKGLYKISSLGRVQRLPRETRCKDGRVLTYKESILKTNNRRGYVFVQLSKNKIKKTYPVHRLVANAFLDNPLNLPVVNHINGVKNDNNVENLEWATVQQNTVHAVKTGLIKSCKGVRQICPQTKKEIGVFKSITEASEKTGVARPHIGAVCNKKPKFKTAGGFIWEYVNEKEYEKSFNEFINREVDIMFKFSI